MTVMDLPGVDPLDPTLPVPVAMLVAALDALAREPFADREPAAALTVASVLLVSQDRLQALALQAVADVDRRGLHELDGCATAGRWLDEQCTSMTRPALALARRFDRLPQVEARVAEGGISVDGAVIVARAVERLRRFVDQADARIDGQPGEQALTAVIVDGTTLLIGEAHGGLADDSPTLVGARASLQEIAARPATQVARLEAAFLLLAAHVPTRLLGRALGVLVDALLPNELARRHEDVHRDRSLELRQDADGTWSIRGRLDAECGELLHTCLTAAQTTDPDNPVDTRTAAELREQGIDPYDPLGSDLGAGGHPRSRTQRRHDALRLILQRLLASKALGCRDKTPVHVAVTVSADALHDQPGALPARGGSGATLPAALARRWLCDSAITRFVMGLGNRVLEVSHTERTLKAHERRILLLETGGICQGAGCCRGNDTGDPLIPHHADAYARNPFTRLRDTVMLCGVDHHDVHEGGKTIRLKDGRLLSPDGWVEEA